MQYNKLFLQLENLIDGYPQMKENCIYISQKKKLGRVEWVLSLLLYIVSWV